MQERRRISLFYLNRRSMIFPILLCDRMTIGGFEYDDHLDSIKPWLTDVVYVRFSLRI